MNVAKQTAAALKTAVDKHVPRIYPHTTDIADAVSTMNAGGAWPGGVEVSPAAAVECWRVVQYARDLSEPLDERFKL